MTTPMIVIGALSGLSALLAAIHFGTYLWSKATPALSTPTQAHTPSQKANAMLDLAGDAVKHALLNTLSGAKLDAFFAFLGGKPDTNAIKSWLISNAATPLEDQAKAVMGPLAAAEFETAMGGTSGAANVLLGIAANTATDVAHAQATQAMNTVNMAQSLAAISAKK